MNEPKTIAQRIFHLIREVDSIEEGRPPKPIDEGDWCALPEETTAPFQVESQAAALVEELDNVLTRSNWHAPPGSTDMPRDIVWHLGKWTQRAAIREILRGYVEPVRHLPLVRNVPEQVVLYLIHELPGGDESLKRERHPSAGVGWHYHYLDRRKGRSNTILSWDTRWKPPVSGAAEVASRRPLFWQFHGEGRADFAARPNLWGDTKRESMHEACRCDLSRPIEEFRPASYDAHPVWPLGTTVTRLPAHTPTLVRNAKVKRRHR
jgi:hypothetical protein